jgi:tetratricopeptide (TPR) repeat protein
MVIAIALSAGLSVARAQGPSSERQGDVAVAARESKPEVPAAQPKAPAAAASEKPKEAAPAAQGRVLSPAAAKTPVPGVDAQAEYEADVQFVTARAFLVNENLPAAAIEPLTKFLALHPEHFQARLMRAYAHGRVGHYEESQADYQAALDVMTGTSADQVLLRAQEFAFTKQREIALTLIEDGIRRLGPMPTLEAAALRLELQLHRTNDAVSRLERMLSRAKRKETLYIKLADIMDEAGYPDKALEARRQALAAIEKLPESEKVGKIKRLHDDLVYRINRAARNGVW